MSSGDTVWKGRVSWWVLLSFKSIITLTIWGFYIKLAARYYVTEHEIRARYGLISKKTSTINIGSVRNVQVRQGILDRFLRIGNVYVGSAGTAEHEIEFKKVSNPAGVRDKIQETVREHGN